MNAIVQNKHIFKDKVVLDVGCGTAILSMYVLPILPLPIRSGVEFYLRDMSSKRINRPGNITMEGKT